ncbi:AfsR/SARP family transcriptional regulator [Amycolatopsis alba]|nr:AfsR/SARP family transcriptional regulator [Amycolatopsis alba]
MRFGVLGTLQVETTAGLVAIRAMRVRALLAVLLLSAPQVVSMERIVGGIWPVRPPRSAVDNVRTYVFQLRSLFEQIDQRDRLLSYPGGYCLAVEPEEVDLLRFQSLADHGHRAVSAGDVATGRGLLEKASTLWRDHPLPELELGAVVRARTTALDEQYWRVRSDLIAARLALGEHAEVVPTLYWLVGERSLDEALWAQLVTALYVSGRTGDALAALATARRTCREELGVDPGPELRELQAVVLDGGDLAKAPRRHQVAGDNAVLSATRALPAAPRNLVGRQGELSRVESLVGSGSPRPNLSVVA